LFLPPLVILVSSTVIEVRHINTGKLLQIFTGRDMRCTWDGTGLFSDETPGPDGWGDVVQSQESRIHICMSVQDPVTKAVGQNM
jgi:hypothetical protein